MAISHSKPSPIGYAQHGKIVSSIRNFVNTFNFMADFCCNFKKLFGAQSGIQIIDKGTSLEARLYYE